MSYAVALEKARQLRESLLDHGVRKVSIELQPGRGPAGDPWYCPTFVRPMSHHIVSTRSQGLTPGLALVKKGRADLAGPLCNAYGGFDMVTRIISMGWANHPGAGGPIDLAGVRIPANNGRPYFFGTEFEGGVRESDWTDEFREYMGRHNAGVSAWLGSPAEGHAEHRTWTSRKVDRLGYTTEDGRREVAKYLHAPREQKKVAHVSIMYQNANNDTQYLNLGGFEVPLNADLYARALAQGIPHLGRVSDTWRERFTQAQRESGKALQQNDTIGSRATAILNLLQQPAAVDATSLAAALAPALIEALGDRTALSTQDVEDAVRRVLGSLDE